MNKLKAAGRKNILQRINLRSRLIAIFIVAFVIPLIVFNIVLFSNLQNILQEKSLNYERENISRIESNVYTYFAGLEKMSKELTGDVGFSSKIGKMEKDYTQKVEYLSDSEIIFSQLSNVLAQRKEIDSIYLYMKTGINYYVNFEDNIDQSYNPRDQAWFSSLLYTGSRPKMLPEQNDMQAIRKNKAVIPFVYPIGMDNSGNADEQNAGILQINIDPAEFKSICGITGSESSKIYIVDADGNVVYNSIQNGRALQIDSAVWNMVSKSGSGNFVLNADSASSKLVTYDLSGYTGLIFITVSDNSEFSNDISNLNTFFIVFILLICFLFIFLSTLIARSISIPIKKLEKLIEEIQANKFEGKIKIDRTRHAGLLGDHINNLEDTLNNFIEKIEYHNEVEQEQERKILEAQINPHFIYNTLNAIRWIAAMQQANEVATAIKSLINLLHSSIRFGRIYIAIKEEVSQIKDYIALQQLRYLDSFKVRYEIDEEVNQYKTIKFMLQPIVENAIFHGINHENKTGEIVIHIAKREDTIEYTVRDNGRGMNEEMLQILNEKEEKEKGFNGIGIRNVNERIKRYFGEGYGLDIKSQLGEGTVIKIVIPAIVYEEESDVEDINR